MQSQEEGLFTKEDEHVLKEIIDRQPQLYLDEIRIELAQVTGEFWSTTTIWRKLHQIGYSLKKAVLRAKQQSEQEVNDYRIRMADRMRHIRQVLFIDETARMPMLLEDEEFGPRLELLQ